MRVATRWVHIGVWAQRPDLAPMFHRAGVGGWMLVFGSGGGVLGLGRVEVGLWRLFPCRGGRDVVDVVAVGLKVSRSVAAGSC